MKVFRNLILGFFLGIFVILMLTVLPTLRYENNIGSSFLRNDFHKRIKLKLTSKIDELSNLISVDKIVGVVYNKSKFHQMEKDIYHIVNYSKTNIIEAKKKYTAILDKMTTKEELKKKTNDVTQSNLSTKDTDAANEHLDKYTKAIRQARKKLLHRCPSLNIETMSKVGVEPGSLDIVITTANFTTSITNEKAKFYIKYPVDVETNKCEPRATTSQFESKKWENVSFRCDHTSSKPCCVQNPSTDYVNGNWGHCVSASKANDNCRCKDCFDYRFRRNSLLFNEIRFQLRSLENNGVFVKSSKHPDGIIGKIFIVYNDGTGNPAPTFLQPDHPNVIAVPHKILWNASGSMEGYPSANRNAIAAQLHHIPGLGQYVMYLEDDMFLNIPLRFGKGHNKYITDDGRIVSYLTNQWIMSHPQPEHGWPG